MQKKPDYIIETPWDAKVFGIDTYEIRSLSQETLEEAIKLRGHFTVKVDPRSSKKILSDYGFYYCDTLVEPYCNGAGFVYSEHKTASVSRSVDIDELLTISEGAFYGRFHRDFNVDRRLADLRYDMWLREHYDKGDVFGLIFDNKLAGFFAFSGNRITLHALSEKYRGKGLAKYLWSAACKELFGMGHRELVSSISTFNTPAVNLYSSLGFKFRSPVDVYHRLVT